MGFVLTPFVGRFERYDARLEVAEDGRAGLACHVDPASMSSADDDGLAARLRTTDLLGCARHPCVRFASTAVAVIGDRVELDGELTIRGRTLMVTGSGAVHVLDGERIALTASTVFDRRQFGSTRNQLTSGDVALAHEVAVRVDLVLARVASPPPLRPTTKSPTL